MFGILILVFVVFVLGFLYAWVAQIVSRDEVSVGKGMAIVVLSTIVEWIAGAAVDAMLPGVSLWLGTAVGLLFFFGSVTLLSHVIAGLELKASLTIGGVFTALMLLVGVAMVACLSAAGPAA